MPNYEPTWAGVKKKKYPALRGRKEAQIAIIGGGLAGVLAAYELAQRGQEVCILEAHEVGAGVTTYTTGFLTHVIDTDLTDLVKMYGAKQAKLIWQSHAEAINRLEKIAAREGIECELVRCPNYVYALEDKELADLEAEKNEAKKLGFASKMVSAGHLNFKQSGAWQLPMQGKFHVLKFIAGLLRKFDSMGISIYENTEAKKLTRAEHGNFIVKTPQGEVRAERVITATYQPFNNPKETWFKKGMYLSYILEAQVGKGEFEEAIYEDMKNPYNYFRIDRTGKFDRMILGGQDHRKEIKMSPERNFTALGEYLNEIMGGRKYKITRKWYSRVLEPSDGLALIGEVNPGEYVATAFSGNGMTYSAIAGQLLADLVTGKKNPYARIYDPTRIPSLYQLGKKARDYTGELFGGAAKNIFKPKKK
jgi:glycine/D-amino acid oxidase-like deaminating enzyme